MGLIGPRPLVYTEREIRFLRRWYGIYQVKPGITGWAQVNGRDTVDLYDKVFYDAENTGFAPESRFVSLLYNALLEIRPKKETPHKEWRLALFKTPEEANYLWEKQTILPITTWDIPLSCLVRIELKPDYREMPELYTALIGWMKHCGLVPEQILTGLVE